MGVLLSCSLLTACITIKKIDRTENESSSSQKTVETTSTQDVSTYQVDFSVDLFLKVMKDNGINVDDQTDTAKSAGFNSILVGFEENKYSFECYDMTDTTHTQNIFNQIGERLSNLNKENADSTFDISQENYTMIYKDSEISNYAKYYGTYVVYAKVNKGYEEKAEQILKQLNF